MHAAYSSLKQKTTLRQRTEKLTGQGKDELPLGLLHCRQFGAKPLTGAAQFRATYIIGLRLGCPEDNPYGDSEDRVDGRFYDLLLW